MRARVVSIAVVVTLALVGAPSAGLSQGASPSPGPLVRPGEPWIVYNGGTGGPSRIRLVRPDGTGDHALVPDLIPANPDGWQQHADWSHDASRIAFGAEQGDGTQDIRIANADGTDAREVYDCADPCGWADHPAWSPDDRTLAFMTATHVGDADSTSALEVLDLATGDRRTVLAAPDLAWFSVPRWAPDGDRLVVEADRYATARFDEEDVTASTIGIVDLTQDTPAFEPLVPWDSFATYPDWSPDGARIVLQLPESPADHGGPSDVHVLELSGGVTLQLTDLAAGGGWGIQPTWTPDGSHVIFVAEDTIRTHPNIAVVASDGTDLERTSDGYFRTHPRLRPTG